MNSAKFRLVKLFRFLVTAREDSPTLDFPFLAQAARNPAMDFLFFEEAASCLKPWWMVSTVSYLLVTFTDIPVGRQIEIILVTKTDLNTMFYGILFLTDSHFLQPVIFKAQ